MIRLYNTLSRKKETLKPIENQRIGMYICGPTVYGPSHLGHGRTYIAFDIIRRYLEWRGFKVKLVSNITDIHDDIIKEAQSRGISVQKLASIHTKEFFEDLEKLKIKKADAYPRVTKHIREIIALIKKLFTKGLAYKAADGSVYFRVARFKNYGRLSGIKLKKAKTGTRVETDKYEKTEAADFALWKKENIEGASWPSPWGWGRPGWHIECSAMAAKHLGEQFEIHGGARDLIFPHHENEIAQSEGATGKSPFVKYWLHSGLLTVDGQKMSKSLKNYIELHQLFQSYEPRVLRFLVASVHYRSPLDFSFFAMAQAKNGLSRIDEFISKMEEIKNQKVNISLKPSNSYSNVLNNIRIAKEKFIKEMDDDFNTPKAIAAIFNLIKEVNKILDSSHTPLNPPQSSFIKGGGPTLPLEKERRGGISRSEASKILKFFEDIDQIFAILPSKKTKIPKAVKNLAQKREKARRTKNWSEADRLRQDIEKLGYNIKDTPEGPKITKI